MKLPQRCPNPTCEADLSDDTIPPDKEQYRDLFSLVRLIRTPGKKSMFQCPVCLHQWPVGSTKSRKRSGNPARRRR